MPSAPALWTLAPFVLLLLGIAVMPLAAPHVWERHFRKVSLALGLRAAVQVVSHHGAATPVLETLVEYASFMALVGSLFVVAGGIALRVKGEATPAVNTLFLLVGALVANVIGTTGASMLLIRPWIRMNKVRITHFHVVFFIFIVSNAGGCLTPVGDPPLFLGYLRGIPFWWVATHVWPAWLALIGALLTVFWWLDRRNFLRVPETIRRQHRTGDERWTFRGRRNLIWLAAILGAVFVPASWRVGWGHASLPVSALVMALAAVLSWKTTPRELHEANDFTLAPVKEVAWLFLGIFLTMRPALELLQSAHGLALDTPFAYYVASGSLSAFLDNAPTYLAFLAAAMGRHGLSIGSPADVGAFAAAHPLLVVAISLGSVFFGAGSYIGNGPNFMVKAIADQAGVGTPHFLRYLWRWSLPVLAPILLVVGWLFLR